MFLTERPIEVNKMYPDGGHEVCLPRFHGGRHVPKATSKAPLAVAGRTSRWNLRFVLASFPPAKILADGAGGWINGLGTAAARPETSFHTGIRYCAGKV